MTLGYAAESARTSACIGVGAQLVPMAAGRRTLAPADERGMVSAEWAVGLIAAIAIAGVLVAIVTSGAVKQALLNIILEVIGWMAVHIPA